MDEPEITELLCGRLLVLIVETDTLRSLVVSMAAAIPRDRLPVDERAMLDEILAGAQQ